MSRKEIIWHQKTTVRFTRLSFTELRLQLVNSSSDAIQRPPHSQITPVSVQIFTGRIWTICLLFWLNLSWFILRGSALQQAHKEQKLVSVASSRVRLSWESENQLQASSWKPRINQWPVCRILLMMWLSTSSKPLNYVTNYFNKVTC